MDRLHRPKSFYLWMALLTTVFVVYGSLVPFQLRAHSLSEALALFSDIRYLQLGASSRADLLANMLIYMPVGFFWAAAVAPPQRRPSNMAKLVGIAALLMALAWLVEFLQLFVAPRTVSRNDLISESLGIVFGIGVWKWCGARFDHTLTTLFERKRLKVSTLWWAYFAAWLIYSLMPFDFFIRVSELKWALDIKGYPFIGLGIEEWQAFSVRDALVLGLEALVAWVAGALLVAASLGKRYGKGTCTLIAVLVFAGVELFQYFEYSGSSSLTSILVKAIAFSMGLRSHFFTHQPGVERWMIRGVRIAKLLWPLYLALVLYIKHWTLMPSMDVQGRFDTLSDLSWVPFYYHYFTTEMAALKSVMLQFAILTPLALFVWCRHTLSRNADRVSLKQQVLWVAAGSFMLETGGLLWSGVRPDYTNVIVMMGAYPLIWLSLDVVFNSLFPPKSQEPQNSKGTLDEPPSQPQSNQRVYIPRPDELPAKQTTSVQHDDDPITVESERYYSEPSAPLWEPISTWFSVAVCAVLFIASAIYIADYPTHLWMLAITTVIVAAFMWRKPALFLILLPACIPWADGYVFTGRFLVTELDLLVMVGLMIHYAQRKTVRPSLFIPKRVLVLLGALSFVYLLSSVWVLFRLQGWGANPQSFFSTENVFRVGKPWLWFLLLLPVLGHHFLHNSRRATRQITLGLCLGLCALLISVMLERWLFTGLWASGVDALHRVRGSFVTMHTGGGHIDAFLVASIPFLLMPWIYQSKRVWRVLALIGGLISFYAIFVTYSRGPYAVAAVVVVMSYLLWRIARKGDKTTKRNWVAGLTSLIAVCWLASPFLIPSFLTERLSIVDRDTNTRVHQWERVLGLVNASPISHLIGMGPGMLPRSIMISNAQSSMPSAYHRWIDDSLGAYLDIKSGRSYYTNQYVTPVQGETYHYRVEYQAPEGDVRLHFSLCEKWIDDSHRCQTMPVPLKKTNGWQSVEGEFTVTAFPKAQQRSIAIGMRPISFSFFTNHNQPNLQLRAISVRDSNNAPLIQNGDFSNQLDHWYITSDNHLDWHAKNIWVNLYFDLGLLGTLLYGALLLVILVAGFKSLREGDLVSLPFVVGLVGYFGVGMVASLFDVPQLTLMMLLLSGVIGLRRVSHLVEQEINHHS